ncbi:MAG: metal-sensitive transcriptional regulator [Candidatus Viridilinea halotolerans]|uniref:Metal-sensitive transcriptional regulator n=1 Tax=Candidatus Viridilinea halotolerans TaxID=2491704 RepID=A0A426TYW7_9CHLR|nr:MAG: metal-sensitive transcriptional regulator [Candidatus Viridilinea halotolerans]
MADEVRTLAPQRRDDVLLRLRRIEGQVRGIQRMVEEGRDCREIVTQVTAIKSALASVNSVVLQCYAAGCLDASQEPREQTIAELIALFQGMK